MKKDDSINSILIVGGGTAGWLTAAIIAGKHRHAVANGKLKITLIEAPDIPIIGVGEGTWPSMRASLHTAGIKESDFIKECQASFKQGSKFVGWRTGEQDDFYYHPFDLPQGFYDANLAQYWVDSETDESFSKMSCVQEHLCERDLSPKLATSADYSGVANYGYHLNAGLFSEFLKKHCTNKLGVELILDRVESVKSDESGDISYVETQGSGDLAADLFVDCTGFRSLLLGQHLGVRFIDKRDEFPIDSALAVQVPYKEGEAIKSATVSTAQEAGWIWDIGLFSRRGVGHVYSSAHIRDEDAEAQLREYVGVSESEFASLEKRKIAINPGYREKFWDKNCVAIGLSAGFLEPLEASAMMLIEASANLVAEQLPRSRAAMAVVSDRFNRRFQYRWERVIDFLKLHYALSDRKEPFWREASSAHSLSERLQNDMALWSQQAPWKSDFDSFDEAFPEASYQYVLYGMDYKTRQSNSCLASDEMIRKALASVSRSSELLKSKAAANRKILELISMN